METPFIIPSFLQGQSVAEILAKMLSVIPDGYDKSDGGFVHDFVMPTAIEKSQMVEFVLVEVIKNMFPLWAYGENLDNLGFVRGIPRKQATNSTGEIVVTGVDGTSLPIGSKFATASLYGEPSTVFSTTEAATLNGETTIPIEANVAGTDGNVAANTIILLSSPIPGVVGVNNLLPTLGGTATETDDAYRQRLIDYDQSQGELYVGSMADYRRWALAVSGVGSATVIPAEDESGLVTIVLTDTEGAPATTALCTKVYDEIMQPTLPYARKAPINAYLSVIPPATVPIEVSANVKISDNTSVKEVTAKYVQNLVSYFPTALSDNEVKYGMIGAILIETEGITDYDNLLLNGDAQNVAIPVGTLPITDGTKVVLSL